MSPIILALILIVFVAVVYGIYKAIMGSWVVPAGILVVALTLIFWVNFGGALAEETVVTVKGAEPVIVDNKLYLRVYFDYKDQELSWYEEVEQDKYFDTTCRYHVVIENKDEVVDAEEVSIWQVSTIIRTMNLK